MFLLKTSPCIVYFSWLFESHYHPLFIHHLSLDCLQKCVYCMYFSYLCTHLFFWGFFSKPIFLILDSKDAESFLQCNMTKHCSSLAKLKFAKAWNFCKFTTFVNCIVKIRHCQFSRIFSNMYKMGKKRGDKKSFSSHCHFLVMLQCEVTYYVCPKVPPFLERLLFRSEGLSPKVGNGMWLSSCL